MRITGGIYRSRRLRAPRGEATRPTSDRVREALFGMLHSRSALDAARVLDLYAGTGALAIEALSRGATSAILVESSRAALAALHANITSLGLQDRTRVLEGDVRDVARRLASCGVFDLVFADPPWVQVDRGDVQRAMAAVIQTLSLSGGALVVLELSARSITPSIEGLVLDQTRRFGDTALAFYKTAILPGASPGSDGDPSE
ncbi:MAG: 16S rRNA (guanine(966)-N(2))-methyltransferase RsmD [Myxococcota bacterium]|nr:16S rRNA (guanine(966)-N(2))-methyltransferase RsmD [Myxococcota bacterium]